MMALLRTLRNIGNCEDVKLKYFTFWRDSSLCCASFRMTRLCFLLRLEIWIIFEMQRLFIILMFLRKQSGNSLANWWSVCFKMFFPNGFICVVASTGSATDCGKFIGLGNKMSSLYGWGNLILLSFLNFSFPNPKGWKNFSPCLWLRQALPPR